MQFLSTVLLLALTSQATAFFGSGSTTTTTFTDDSSLKVPGENPLTYCEDPVASKHILLIKNVDLTPNPPEAGQTLLIKASGNLTSKIEDGAYVQITVKLGLITLLRKTENLCEQVKQVDKECPLQPGPLEVEKSVDLPREIPPAKFTVTANVYTVDDETVTCLIGAVDFAKKSLDL